MRRMCSGVLALAAAGGLIVWLGGPSSALSLAENPKPNANQRRRRLKGGAAGSYAIPSNGKIQCEWIPWKKKVECEEPGGKAVNVKPKAGKMAASEEGDDAAVSSPPPPTGFDRPEPESPWEDLGVVTEFVLEEVEAPEVADTDTEVGAEDLGQELANTDVPQVARTQPGRRVDPDAAAFAAADAAAARAAAKAGVWTIPVAARPPAAASPLLGPLLSPPLLSSPTLATPSGAPLAEPRTKAPPSAPPEDARTHGAAVEALTEALFALTGRTYGPLGEGCGGARAGPRVPSGGLLRGMLLPRTEEASKGSPKRSVLSELIHSSQAELEPVHIEDDQEPVSRRW